MNAVIYARYSSDNQSEESIMAQLRACREYAEKNNIKIVDQYIDRAQSARSDQRQSFQKMINDSNKKSFQAVIVHKLDRFSRDRYDHAIYRKKLRDNGVKLISVLENLDDSPESVVLESVLEGFSEYYSRNLARETRKGLREVALQAKFTGGCPPFGFDIDADNNYVVNEKEKRELNRMYYARYYKIGYTYILEDLKRRGIKTKFGKPFTKSSIIAILQNQKNIGTYIYYPNGKEEPPIILEDALPSLVPKKIFWKVNEDMKSRKQSGRVRAIEPYLLSSILFCGECGSAMHGHRRQKNGKNYYSYECGKHTSSKQCDSPSYSRDKLEKIICDYIKTLISDNAIKNIKKYLIDNAEKINGNAETNKKILTREITAIDRKINTIIDMLIETPSDKLKAKLLELEDQQNDLKREYDKMVGVGISEEKLDEYIVKIQDFDNLTRTQKSIYVQKLIKKVTAHKDGNIEIETTYDEVVNVVGGATPSISTSLPWWIYCIKKYDFKNGTGKA